MKLLYLAILLLIPSKHSLPCVSAEVQSMALQQIVRRSLASYTLTQYMGKISRSQNDTDQEGYVKFSSDGSIIAFGNSNKLQIYQDTGSSWYNIGYLSPEYNGERYGWGLGLSADGTIIAGGGQNRNCANNDSYCGKVRIRQYSGSGTIWNNYGTDIWSTEAYARLGASVALSDDALYMFVGSTRFYLNYIGKVEIYQYTTDWVRVASITGTTLGGEFGLSLDISSNGSRIIVGEPGATDDLGMVRIYSMQGGTVTLMTSIDGQSNGIKHRFGTCVAMSNDGNVVAVGAPGLDGNYGDYGYVEVYEYSSVSLLWTQKGSTIEYEINSNRDQFGQSVDLSSDGLRLVVASPDSNIGGTKRGLMRVYEYNSSINDWNQIGNDVYGDNDNDNLSRVAITNDGNRVAALYGGGGTSNGAAYVRVFTVDALPNPTPSAIPSYQPSSIPTYIPSRDPTTLPSSNPSLLPTLRPSQEPSMIPTKIPSVLPSMFPSSKPSFAPSFLPSIVPSNSPSLSPSLLPSDKPSFYPSFIPSLNPSVEPSLLPSSKPSFAPSSLPTVLPTKLPTLSPSSLPSDLPTLLPTKLPSLSPSSFPSDKPSLYPSFILSTVNSSLKPSLLTSALPSFNVASSMYPLSQPTYTTSSKPSVSTTRLPSFSPPSHTSAQPSSIQTLKSSILPSFVPTFVSSSIPSVQPLIASTLLPSFVPILDSSIAPTSGPTVILSSNPSISRNFIASNTVSSVPSSSLIYDSKSLSNVPTTEPSNKKIVVSGDPTGSSEISQSGSTISLQILSGVIGAAAAAGSAASASSAAGAAATLTSDNKNDLSRQEKQTKNANDVISKENGANNSKSITHEETSEMIDSNRYAARPAASASSAAAAASTSLLPMTYNNTDLSRQEKQTMNADEVISKENEANNSKSITHKETSEMIASNRYAKSSTGTKTGQTSVNDNEISRNTDMITIQSLSTTLPKHKVKQSNLSNVQVDKTVLQVNGNGEESDSIVESSNTNTADTNKSEAVAISVSVKGTENVEQMAHNVSDDQNEKAVNDSSNDDIVLISTRSDATNAEVCFDSSNDEEMSSVQFRKKGTQIQNDEEDSTTEMCDTLMIAEGGLEDGVEDWRAVKRVMDRMSTRDLSENRSISIIIFVVIGAIKIKDLNKNKFE